MVINKVENEILINKVENKIPIILSMYYSNRKREMETKNTY